MTDPILQNVSPDARRQKVTWQKAGKVTAPGRYMFRFGWLTVTADDLAVWRQYPEAQFTLVKQPADAGDADADQDEYHLGLFELPSSQSSAC